LEYFKNNPKPFYELASELYPGKFKPTLTHKFIKLLADNVNLSVKVQNTVILKYKPRNCCIASILRISILLSVLPVYRMT